MVRLKVSFLNLNYNLFKTIFPGILLIAVVVFIATIISSYIFIGTVASAIILGILINQFFPIPKSCQAGIKFSEKTLLSVAIILLGSTLNVTILSFIDLKILGILILLICTSIIISLLLGKLFNLSSPLSLLLGIGNGICGSSAIAGASTIVNAEDDDIGISISAINIIGAIGIFLVPFLINLFFNGNLQEQGIVIGSTIQAVGQVTAAGFIMGNEVGEMATLIKMIRILMLGPILILLTLLYSSKNKQSNKNSVLSIPPFIIGFIILGVLTNYELIPLNLLPVLKSLSKYFLLFAMTAIGLRVSLKSIIDKGYKVFLVSSITFLFQIVLVIYLLS